MVNKGTICWWSAEELIGWLGLVFKDREYKEMAPSSADSAGVSLWQLRAPLLAGCWKPQKVVTEGKEMLFHSLFLNVCICHAFCSRVS